MRTGYKAFLLFPFISIACFLSCHSPDGNLQDKDALFQLLPSSQTGIAFRNDVTDNSQMNILSYHNFYNGGGVAVGDINNDGRPDIFFTANQQSNKLYLNKGNLQFEDITAKAGIISKHQWHTGVVMADVNGDGWLDIYVCNAGIMSGDDNSNELYINQKNGTFTEEAKQYGLDDKGLSTQAVFFDYDHDGDLDCFIINNSNRSVENFGYTKIDRSVRDAKNGDRLYRNDGGIFTDVSVQAGIWGNEIGFGLGISVADVNNDGWDDVYIDNDFFERDYLYINQHNGTFKEEINEQMKHISNGSMGVDMADYNNDGNVDIFTAEMLPETDYRLKTTVKFDDYDIETAKDKLDFHHQFTSNSLQLNNGDNTFGEISQLAGVDATGWSWSPLFFDMDNDGWKDLFVSNGLYKDLTDQDFLEYVNNEMSAATSSGQQIMTKHELIQKIPSVAIPNYGFLNQKNLSFSNQTQSLGFGKSSFSSGAAYADLDGDGDMDLVVNNVNEEAFVYRNMTTEKAHPHYLSLRLSGNDKNTFGIGAKVKIYADRQMQCQEQMPVRGFQSSVEPVLHFGLGQKDKLDSLVVEWPNEHSQTVYNIRADTTLTLTESDANEPIYRQLKSNPVLFARVDLVKGQITHHENEFVDFDKERLLPKLLSTEGPKLCVGDINGDGLDDFFMGSATGDTSKIFIQKKDGMFSQLVQSAFIKDKYYEDAGVALFDADEDGDLDLAVASGGNEALPGTYYSQTRLYLNDGKGMFTRDTASFPQVAVNASCITLCDVNEDGKLDLFIGARSVPGNYGLIPQSTLLINHGKGQFIDETKSLAPDLLRLGMVTASQWQDMDGDGKKELIVAGDWMPVTFLSWKNKRLSIQKTISNSSGWWNSLQVADINGDGKPDLLAGNLGLNSRIKVSPQQPAEMYVSDWDKNGQTDCIPVYYKADGKAYPYYLKGELQAQIPSLKKRFLHFSDYASKSIGDIFSKDQLKQAEVLTVTQSQTCVFINNGNEDFSIQPLPVMAQLSPVYGILAKDLNGDGITDLFMAGNFYGYKPQTGRMDASYGTTLLQNAKHQFTYLPPAQSGLFVDGQARDIAELKTADKGTIIIVAMNNAPLCVFKKSKNK